MNLFDRNRGQSSLSPRSGESNSVLATEPNVIAGAWASFQIVEGKPLQCIRVSIVKSEATELVAEIFTGRVGCEEKFLPLLVPGPAASLRTTKLIESDQR